MWQSDKKCDNILIKKCKLVYIGTFVCCWIVVSNKISIVGSLVCCFGVNDLGAEVNRVSHLSNGYRHLT